MSYFNIEVVRNKWVVIKKPYWAEDEIFSAKCIDMIYSPEKKAVAADVTKTSKKALAYFIQEYIPQFLQPSNKNYKEQVTGQIKEAYARHIRVFEDTYIPKLLEGNSTPFKHQKDCLFNMHRKRDNWLFLDMGLGKTYTSASLSKTLDLFPILVICPTLVKWNWYHDLTDKFGYDPTEFTIIDSQKRLSFYAGFEEKVVIINYEMLPKYMDALKKRNFKHIIADECHKAKSTSTRNFKKLYEIRNHFKDARLSLLSGTPMPNRVIDLFAYLKASHHPLGKNKQEFINRYARTSGRGNKIVGIKNISELRLRISNIMIRLKTEECIDLPDLNISKFHIPMDDHIQEYKKAIGEILFGLKGKDVDDMTSKELMAFKAHIMTLNRVTTISKVKAVSELIQKIIDAGRKPILFTSFKDPLYMLQDKFKDQSLLIDGSVNPHKRDKIISEFKTNPDKKVFLGQITASGIGINLTNSQDVIIMNMVFTPDQIEQAQKRAHRIGQKFKVNVYYIICDGTMDEYIYNMVATKAADNSELIDKGQSGIINYSDITRDLLKNIISTYGN